MIAGLPAFAGMTRHQGAQIAYATDGTKVNGSMATWTGKIGDR